jgi:hypothetical protein
MEESTAINFDRDKRFYERFASAQRNTADRNRLASDGHIAFFDKLAVLSAGSIGVSVSLLGAVLTSKSSALLTTRSAKYFVCASLFLLLLSLLLCLVHNHLQLGLLKRLIPLSRLIEDQVMLGRGFDFGNYSAMGPFQQKEKEYEDASEAIERADKKISIVGSIASSCFGLGYLCVIVWIVTAIVTLRT